MTPKQLPERPNLEQYKNQAKDLLSAARTGDSRAVDRIRSARAEGLPERPIRLADAQRAVAFEFGFRSWRAFRRHLDLERDARPLDRGDAVVVTAGPFAGQSGEVEQTRPERDAIVVAVAMGARSVGVWLSPMYVERAL